jgi:Glycosyl hydrolases family 39
MRTKLKIGTNAFHWVKPSVLDPFSMVRLYACWHWFEDERGLNRFEPTMWADGNYDTLLKSISDSGKEAVLCISTTPAWLTGDLEHYAERKDWRPHAAGADPINPVSYQPFARFLFQVAARYGRKTHPHELLTIDSRPRWTNDPPNVKKSGLATLKYIEVWNEPDKFWRKGTNDYFEPEQYAACLSACYNAIKLADPTMKVVMAGLTNFDVVYLSRMYFWVKQNLNGKFPADVINLHHYCNETSNPETFFTKAIPPERDHVSHKLKVVVDFCKNNYPNLPVWYSEFGYDTVAPSLQLATGIPGVDNETIQAQWLCRNIIEGRAGGADALFVYNAIDEGASENGGLFQSCGVASKSVKQDRTEVGQKPKSAFFEIARLSQLLGNWNYIGSVPDIPPGCRAYVFTVGRKMRVIHWMTEHGASGVFKYRGLTIVSKWEWAIQDFDALQVDPDPPKTRPIQKIINFFKNILR